MKKYLDEKDPDIRWLLKTFPFVGVITALVIGYVTFQGLIDQSIKILQYRYSSTPAYVTLAERPVDYVIIISLLIFLFSVSLGYCIFRIAKRHALRREDSRK